ncbi:hypothetical protein H2201_000143 [Coniosporium apollinis]|uniref:Short-chain dehydrogenase n=1 Tax=Coniosporium apollinis TaxID=61459 RepID=A0ABQ9PA64_9PEZI|nr:hypothetical protein H2201_000143 [Coniosporium apollinis]
MKTLDFNCTLITGGSGGIGRAMAQHLISQSEKVIIARRTESTLQSTAKEIGAAAYYILDTGAVSAIPSFTAQVTKDHPDLDRLVAGVQRPLQVLEMKPEEFLGKADQEIDINICGPMHLTLGLLEHFRGKKEGAVGMNVSSVLGFIPTSVINPVYNGTKAWLHFWSMKLRTQLKDTNIKVVEIAPPTVATNLHRERTDPDDNKKEKNPNALSVDEFMNFVIRGWKKDRDVIGAGMSEKVVE